MSRSTRNWSWHGRVGAVGIKRERNGAIGTAVSLDYRGKCCCVTKQLPKRLAAIAGVNSL
ncbi:MAG: hypothetical protein HY675_09040 [Chloroflexi bacterium]|nr:hypothetical protein [Chloroflexota bacterium]